MGLDFLIGGFVALPSAQKWNAPISHSISRHLSVEVDNFNRAIRDFVPGFETMLWIVAEHVAGIRDGSLLLQLVAGTGALSGAIQCMGHSALPS